MTVARSSSDGVAMYISLKTRLSLATTSAANVANCKHFKTAPSTTRETAATVAIGDSYTQGEVTS